MRFIAWIKGDRYSVPRGFLLSGKTIEDSSSRAWRDEIRSYCSNRYIVAVFSPGVFNADTHSRADFLQVPQNRPSGDADIFRVFIICQTVFDFADEFRKGNVPVVPYQPDNQQIPLDITLFGHDVFILSVFQSYDFPAYLSRLQDNILQLTEIVGPEQIRVVVFVGLLVLPGGMEGDVDAIASEIKDGGDVGLE